MLDIGLFGNMKSRIKNDFSKQVDDFIVKRNKSPTTMKFLSKNYILTKRLREQNNKIYRTIVSLSHQVILFSPVIHISLRK